jgi:tetratricopeptide (TPR) repeat protein
MRIAEATRRLQTGNLDNARRILAPVLEREEVQEFVYATRIRQCSSLLEQFDALREAEVIYRERYLPLTDDESGPVKLIPLMARQGNVEEAVQHAEAILNEENAALIAFNLVVVLRTNEVTSEQRQRVGAIVRRAIGSDPENVLPLNLLADYQDYAQDYEAAEQTYLRILDRNPRHPVALNNLAWLIAMRETNPMRIQQATRMIDQVIDVIGPTPELQDTKATVEMAAGRFSNAIDFLKKSIAVSPSGKKYYRLSLAQLRAGQQDLARESYRQAVAEGFDPAQLHPLERDDLKELQGALLVRN